MRGVLFRVVLLILFAGSAGNVMAVTTVNVSTNVVVSGVRRFGIGLAQHNYYDSGQMMKELLFRNPGFEGLLFQSVVRLGTNATASTVYEDQPLGAWTSGFWNGAGYEIIWSSAAAKDRAGTLASSVAAYRPGAQNHDPAGSPQGTTYHFADSDPARIPAAGDYLVLRKVFEGGSGAGAAFGSWDAITSGGTVTTELADLPPPPAVGPAGRQCVRLTALGAGHQASVRGQFDTLQGFVLLNGQFRLAFKAKGLGGAGQMQISVRRGTTITHLNRTIQLTGDWAEYSEPFPASETNTVTGAVSVTFACANQSEILLDDVSLRRTDSDAGNPTEFRDEVVEALRGLRPGILRYVNWQDAGNTLDNSLAPPFARRRSGYSVYSTTENNMMPGLHEFLVLCEHLGAEPWYCMPATFSPQEAAGLMEYLGGPEGTPYGDLRAARGHAEPWTNVFPRIHLEFANENWNNTAFRGGCISASVPCGNRASELFGVVKGSPYHAPGRFQCVLGGQTAAGAQNLQLHNASPLHDALVLAPYMAGRVDQHADDEQLFGSLFAEPEWWSTRPSVTSGFMRLNFDLLNASSRPVPVTVYEVNLHTTSGTIPQQRVDEFTPSVGAAIAVADHMLVMLRELGCRDQCFFSLPGHRTAFTDGGGRTAALWGAVLDMGRTNRKRPHYHAQQMLNRVLGGDLLQTVLSGDNPTWSVTNLNRTTYTNAHYLQSHAFRDGARRGLVLFNLHRTGPLDVNFSGPYAPEGDVTRRLLTSTAITNNNETAEIVAPVEQAMADFDPAQSLALPPFSMTVLEWSEAGLSLDLAKEPPSVRLHWDSHANRRYQVQYSPDLSDWFDAGSPVPGTGGPVNFLDDGTPTGGTPPISADRRYYRLDVRP